jgi:hypothetical protein
MIVTGFDERLDRETLRDVVSSAWGGISYTYELKPSRKELGRRPCFFALTRTLIMSLLLAFVLL